MGDMVEDEHFPRKHTCHIKSLKVMIGPAR